MVMEALTLTPTSFWISPRVALNSGCKLNSRVLVKCLTGGEPHVSSLGPITVNGSSCVGVGSSNAVEIGDLGHEVAGNKRDGVCETLEHLWDDGYGTESVKDYFKIAKDMIKSDGGPPRWFCPISCGRPLKDSPVLLYLPGLDGLGTGLILHEKPLGKVFEVRSLHIPIQDRTSLEDLVQIVEETVRLEHASSPNKPIYLLGDSFGGCLALAVAARNPTIDLVLILANPATSFERSQLPTLLFLLEALPDILYGVLNLIFLSAIRGLGDILPKDTLIWRLKLLKSAAAYTNSHLQDITAEVLVLASYKDKLLPSKDEAERLARSLKNCGICFFKGNSHQFLLESDNNLLTTIKGTSKYRHSSNHDTIKDFLPPSMSEYTKELKGHWLYRLATSPVTFSTLEDGTIVKGLAGVPSDGPVMFVSNHMLFGLDLFILFLEFLKEKRITLRGLGHPEGLKFDSHSYMPYISVILRVFGILPVSAINLFKLLSNKSHVLLYPGGAREALHRKGEVHKLFWPDEPEFVRMAMKFGATIVPFASVGEDDISHMILDYNDMMEIPKLNNYLEEANRNSVLLRQGKEGEVANQQLYFPIIVPKIPGRFYYLFGKPIKTRGMEKMLNDKEHSRALYMQIKCEVEECIAYLVKKREEDPYRGLMKRLVYQVTTGTPLDQVPTFEP